jgi:hypothetical protein
VRNPIDAFVLQKLRENGLTPAPETDRRTLIRRLSFDLVGLPPTPAEVAAFEHDHAPDAYERLVDHLLASPHYGERWARHWLDLVRFAETHGYERDDPKPHAWRYRDWVIAALNRDLPYDRFVVEQLAGDELPDASPETLTATGLYRLGLIDDEPADSLMDRFDQLDDMVRTVGTTMLGLTMHCARCHDHKFDPISQADYYRMVAFFAPGKPYARYDENSILVGLASPSERARFQAETADIDRRIASLEQILDRLLTPYRQALRDERIRKLPDFDNDTIAAIQTPADRRDPYQLDRFRAVARLLRILPKDVQARLTPEDRDRKADLEQRIQQLQRARPQPLPQALGLVDAGAMASPTKILIRGDAHRPGQEVQPAFPSSIDPVPPVIRPPGGKPTTGRRLALARWIARSDNPLTARVMVNRLWQHHFGRGLVGTPSDFGNMGEEPSHPELLDWLASEFVARGWSLKAMHRLMVTSSTYRQSGQWNERAARIDPGDAWLWRMAPRRLEAEPIRDAILAVSGVLNSEIGGPSVRPRIDQVVLAGQSRPGNGWKVSEPHDANRRSVYVYVKRTLALPELELLDAADNNEPCSRRSVTTTAPQALMLLNGTFLNDQAGHFAERLLREVGDAPAAQVERAFQLALARPPSTTEQNDSLEFLDAMANRVALRPRSEDRSQPGREALRALCLVLLNTNEFVTVD